MMLPCYKLNKSDRFFFYQLVSVLLIGQFDCHIIYLLEITAVFFLLLFSLINISNLAAVRHWQT